MSTVTSAVCSCRAAERKKERNSSNSLFVVSADLLPILECPQLSYLLSVFFVFFSFSSFSLGSCDPNVIPFGRFITLEWRRNMFFSSTSRPNKNMPSRTKFHSHASEPLKAPKEEASYSPGGGGGGGGKGKNHNRGDDNLFNEKKKIEAELKAAKDQNKHQMAITKRLTDDNEKLKKSKKGMDEENENTTKALQLEQTKRCQIESELLGQQELNRHMETKMAALQKKLDEAESMPVAKIACERCYNKATKVQSRIISTLEGSKIGMQCIDCYSTYGNREGVVSIIDKTPVVRSIAYLPEVVSTSNKISEAFSSSSSVVYKLFIIISCASYLCFILSFKIAYFFSPVRWIRSSKKNE